MGNSCHLHYQKFVSLGFASGFLLDRASFGLVSVESCLDCPGFPVCGKLSFLRRRGWWTGLVD